MLECEAGGNGQLRDIYQQPSQGLGRGRSGGEWRRGRTPRPNNGIVVEMLPLLGFERKKGPNEGASINAG